MAGEGPLKVWMVMYATMSWYIVFFCKTKASHSCYQTCKAAIYNTQVRITYASQSTPMMTAAGMLYYQALFFSHFHYMILAPLNQRLQNHFGRWFHFTFHPLGDIIDEFSILVALKTKTTTYSLSKLHQPVACKLDESMDESRGGREQARSHSRPSGYGTGTQQKANADSCVCPHSNKQAVETLWWIMKLPCFDNVVLKPKAMARPLYFAMEVLTFCSVHVHAPGSAKV